MEGKLLFVWSILGNFDVIFGVEYTMISDPAVNVSFIWNEMVGRNINPYDASLNKNIKYPLSQYLLPDSIFFPPNGPFNDVACGYRCSEPARTDAKLTCNTRFTTSINAVNGTAFKVYWFDYNSDKYNRVDFSTCNINEGVNSQTNIDTVMYIVNNTAWGAGGSYNNYKRAGILVPRNPIRLIDQNDDTFVPKICTTSDPSNSGSGSIVTLSSQTTNSQDGYYAIIVGSANEHQSGTVEIEVTCNQKSDPIRTLNDDFPVSSSDMTLNDAGGLKGSFECGHLELQEVGYGKSECNNIFEGSTSALQALHYYKFTKKSDLGKFALKDVIISTCWSMGGERTHNISAGVSYQNGCNSKISVQEPRRVNKNNNSTDEYYFYTEFETSTSTQQPYLETSTSTQQPYEETSTSTTPFETTFYDYRKAFLDFIKDFYDVEIPPFYDPSNGPAELYIYFGRIISNGDEENYRILEQCGTHGCESTPVNERCRDSFYGVEWPKITIDAESLEDGEYFIAIGGESNLPSNYRLQVTCVSEYVGVYGRDLAAMCAVVAGTLFVMFSIFLCVYWSSVQRYKRRITKRSGSIVRKRTSSKVADVTEVELMQSTPTIGDNAAPRPMTTDMVELETRTDQTNIVAVNVEYSRPTEMISMLEDMLKDVENGSGLDIYQVLSFRQLDIESYEADPVTPCKDLGCGCTVLSVAKYHRNIFVVIVVGILQSVGLSIILFNVVLDYMQNGNEDAKCEYTFKDWEEQASMKLLSFFWCAVVALSITTLLAGINGNGFNKMLRNTDIISRIKTIDPFICQIGVLINFYSLTLAVFGSFFIIYKSEGGSDALDMVLNAVALFFMLELDDWLVTDEDYSDCARVITKNLGILKDGDINNDYYDENDVDIPRRCCGDFFTVTMIKTGKILLKIVPWILGICSIITPFIVMICF